MANNKHYNINDIELCNENLTDRQEKSDPKKENKNSEEI